MFLLYLKVSYAHQGCIYLIKTLKFQITFLFSEGHKMQFQIFISCLFLEVIISNEFNYGPEEYINNYEWRCYKNRMNLRFALLH